MAKLGQRCNYRAFTGVVALLFLVSSFGCHCFSHLPTFVGKPPSRPCTDRQRGVGNAIRSSNSDDTGSEEKSMLEFLSPINSCKVNQMSGTDLAYIGDVVFELFVRSRHVWPSKRTSDLQNTVVGLVRGEFFRNVFLFWIDAKQQCKIRGPLEWNPHP